MKPMRIEEVIRLGLLLTEGGEVAEHPLKTNECPTIPEFERLAAQKAKPNLKRLLHIISGCRYCQLNLSLFQQELGVRPWWNAWREQLQKLWESVPGPWVPIKAKGNVVVEQERPLGTIPALVLQKDGEVIETTIHVTQKPKVSKNGRLVLRVRHPGKIETVELMLLAGPEANPIGDPLSLSAGKEEPLEIELPPELREAWQGKEWEWRELPFRFVMRPTGTSNEQILHAS